MSRIFLPLLGITATLEKIVDFFREMTYNNLQIQPDFPVYFLIM
jgi:hypothetical protein